MRWAPLSSDSDSARRRDIGPVPIEYMELSFDCGCVETVSDFTRGERREVDGVKLVCLSCEAMYVAGPDGLSVLGVEALLEFRLWIEEGVAAAHGSASGSQRLQSFPVDATQPFFRLPSFRRSTATITELPTTTTTTPVAMITKRAPMPAPSLG